MAKLKERFTKWKENRSLWQKAGDILFWVLIILLLIPGPRKAILTTLNRVVLNVKAPRMMNEEKQERLTDLDYNWVLARAENEPFYFSKVRDEVVFVNFWATWCPPCVAELPEIQKAWEKHGESVAFLLVTNQEPSVVEAFMEKHGYTVPVHYAGSAPPSPLEYRSIPTTFILSPDGKIAVHKKGAINWDSKGTDRIFEELLK